jgi:hypothetical protein
VARCGVESEAGLGHIHLGKLPATRKWREVTELLTAGSDAQEVAAASAIAAESDLLAAANDPLFVETVRLLSLIPQAAKQDDFVRALREIGIDAPASPSLLDLMMATTAALDRFATREKCRSDFGELSVRALADSLAAAVGARLPSLFEPNAAEVQTETARLARSDAFSSLSRHFFGRLVSEALSSWLSRALSAHVGAGKAFANAAERSAFDRALEQYCSESTRIIQVFAGGWYGKTLFRDGTITSERAAAFGAVAFKKITEELKRKRSDHD